MQFVKPLKKIAQIGIYVGVLFCVPLLMLAAERLVPCEGNACRACDVRTLLKKLIDFMIMLGGFIATILLMFAGFTMVTAAGNMGKIEEAKSTFKAVIIGMFIILTGYLIVDTFMKTFVTGSVFNGAPWDNITCVPNPLIERTPPAAIGGGGTVVGGGSTVGATPGDVAALQQAGVTVQSGVNMSQVSGSRITQAVEMASACSIANGGTATSNACGVQISSGYRAGNGQSNHGNGTAVDISGRNETFNRWMNSQTAAPSAFGGYRTINTGQGACTWHPNEGGGGYHWHCSDTGR
ncbi:pilin [Patescibacteria group bacterium]|nr:pilin [Patescibacteria group bacterium]